MWVSGPNLQFICTVHGIQQGFYDWFYLMEMDSVPITTFWLDSLVDEVESYPDGIIMLGR
jgi:hypothetical protein